MKILHVGVFRDHVFGGDLLLERGLKANGCVVERFDARTRVAENGLPAMRTALSSASVHQDAILVGKGETLDAPTLREIRSNGVHILLWYGDVRPEPEPWLLELLPHVDCFYMSSGGAVLKEHFVRGRPGLACFFTHPMDSEVVDAFDELPRGTRDIVFTGTGYGFAGPERRRTIDYLKTRQDVDFFGGADDHGTWKGRVRRIIAKTGRTRSRVVRGRDYAAVIRSARIGVGVGARNDVYKYTSDRLSHYLGLGSFFLCWRFKGVGELFVEGEELECFSSMEELDRKLDTYLSDHDAREAIAERGRKRQLTDYSCAQMVGMMLDVAKTGRSDRYPWVEVYGSSRQPQSLP